MDNPTGNISYSVIIPCYNDSTILASTHERLSAVMAKLSPFYEIVYVDDASRDNTFHAIKELQKKDSGHVVGLRLLRNFGQHAAISAGFSVVRGDVIITLDSDLEDPPEELPRLIAKLSEGYEVVAAVRSGRSHGLIRILSSRVINFVISRATGVSLRDYGCMFRVYKKEVLGYLDQCKELNRFLPALVSWLNVSIAEVEIQSERREDKKKSRYSFYKLLDMALDISTSYSNLPIKIITVLGILSIFIGTCLSLFLVGYRIFVGPGISGMISFIAVLLLISGIQMGAVGLVGNYVGRIFTQVQNRPYFIIREEVRGERT